MKRHIVFICVAYILGIIVGLYNIYIAPFFLLVIICIPQVFKSRINLATNIIIVILVFYILGCVSSFAKHFTFKNKYEDGWIHDSGIIIQLVSSEDYYNKYLIKNQSNDKFIIYILKDIIIQEMDIIEFYGEFEKPSASRNNNCFDYSKYLYSQNIYGTIFVKSVKNIQIVGKKSSIISSVRNSIILNLKSIMDDRTFGILLGMIIGDTSYIDDYTENAFKICGITHLLAVSGSNISYVILFSKFLFDKLFGKKFSNCLSIFTVFMFVFVSGASASVLRAGLMACIIIFSDITLNKSDTISSICLSAVIILLYNPLTLFDIGFILSYGGTIGIIFLYKPIVSFLSEKINKTNNSLVNALIDYFSITFSAQLILLPIMAIINALVPDLSISIDNIFSYLEMGFNYIPFALKCLLIPSFCVEIVVIVFTTYLTFIVGIRAYQFIMRIYKNFKP